MPLHIALTGGTVTPKSLGMASKQEIAERIAAAGQRARAEAEARRAEQAKAGADAARAKEIGGRGGLDPTRYGDWEIKGIACDF
jgi:hypothetical protein